MDRSGKCDVVPVNSDHAVFGVVYEIDAAEEIGLDRAEGLGHGYIKKNKTVILNGDTVSAATYFATCIDPTVKPYTWYKTMVVAGAREHGLPAYYIASLEKVEALEDPDRSRHDREMRIVSGTNCTDGTQV